jgi:hypothetical protein
MLPETLKPPEPQWRFGSHLEPEKKIFVVEGSSNLLEKIFVVQGSSNLLEKTFVVEGSSNLIAIKYPLRKVCS